MRLSLKESRMKLLNATNLDRKSGIRGPKTKFFECFSYPSRKASARGRRVTLSLRFVCKKRDGVKNPPSRWESHKVKIKM